MSRKQGTLELSSNIEPTAAAPLDARTVVPTLADLTASGAFPYPYVGMIVSVQATGKVYTLTASDPTVLANWKELGSGASGDSVEWVDELPEGTDIEDKIYATRGFQCVADEEFVFEYTRSIHPVSYASWLLKPKYVGKLYLYYNNTWNAVAEVVTKVIDHELLSLTFRSGTGSEFDIATYNVGETFTIKITGDDTAFFYAGDSENEVLTQIDNKMYHFPTPISALEGKIYQYIGDDDDTNGFYNGLFYTCVSDEESTPTYYWIPTEEWVGTHAAWEALPQAIKNHYHQKKVNFTDDDEIADVSQIGDIYTGTGTTGTSSGWNNRTITFSKTVPKGVYLVGLTIANAANVSKSWKTQPGTYGYGGGIVYCGQSYGGGGFLFPVPLVLDAPSTTMIINGAWTGGTAAASETMTVTLIKVK